MLIGWILIGAVSASANEYIVRLNEGVKIGQLKSAFSPMVVEYQSLINDLDIYRLNLSSNASEQDELSRIRKLPFVKYAQLNHQLKWRKSPNDPSYSKQWSLSSSVYGVGAPEVWDSNTGGKDGYGNDVVVAIVDGGFDVEHPDLKPNVWSNPGEIPGNGKDDDGNGFVDDVYGWNSTTHSGKVGIDNHGTHVAGIVGAKGNNAVGVSGVNWNVKLLFVGIENATTAEATEAYGYVIKIKRLWRTSGGKKGANVVVTNSSFGLDGANCASGEYPVWNDLFNQLGAEGVLSATAVPNENWNIDKVGDVPSACSSDYIIAVTNMMNTGVRSTMAGYGVKSVDIASPGEDILSTVFNEYDPYTGKQTKYAVYSGTSMATPHVAGSVAMMFATADQKLINEYMANPAQAALTMKGLLLNSVQKTTNFSTQVSSGGYLNLAAAVKSVSSY